MVIANRGLAQGVTSLWFSLTGRVWEADHHFTYTILAQHQISVRISDNAKKRAP